MKRYIKTILKKLGYEIYNTKCLPPGWDLVADINKIFQDLSQIKTVFDVGANKGQTALYFSQKLPKAHIFSFEPAQESFNKLLNQTANLERVSCFNHAFGEKKEVKKINIKNNPLLNTLVDYSDSPTKRHETIERQNVNVDTIDDFCSKNGVDSIDILKIDTEGYEMKILQGCSRYLSANKIKCIYCEVGWNKEDKGHSLFLDTYSYLFTQNFRLYALYDYFHRYYKPGLLDNDGSFGLWSCNALFINSDAIQQRIERKWWLL